MWSSSNSYAANVAEIAGEETLHAILREKKINPRSPSASGRIAMAVYHYVMSAGCEPGQAAYFCSWWANDGGDLEPVPDGTPPELAPEPSADHWV